jgi:hypothetical protein
MTTCEEEEWGLWAGGDALDCSTSSTLTVKGLARIE